MADEPMTQRPWWVSDVKECWRWMSVQFAVLTAAIPIVAEMPGVKDLISDRWLHVAIVVSAVLTVIGRLKNQGGVVEQPKP